MSTSPAPEFSTVDPGSTRNRPSQNRPRKSGGVIALLVLLTLANVVTLVLTVGALGDDSVHGDDAQVIGLLTFSVVTTLVGLTGLAGAWATRKWGPLVYLGAVVIDRLVAAVAAPEMIPLMILGIVFAALLVRASRNW